MTVRQGSESQEQHAIAATTTSANVLGCGAKQLPPPQLTLDTHKAGDWTSVAP